MNYITIIATFISEISILIGVIIGLVRWAGKITEGMKCQLRSDMLCTYYHNRERKQIRQYELENFVHLYEAYKALKGNSFIDKIYEEVMTWEVIT